MIDYIIEINTDVGQIKKALEYQNGTLKELNEQCNQNTASINRFKGAMALGSIPAFVGLVVLLLRFLVSGG
jgi:hypothetical protein